MSYRDGLIEIQERRNEPDSMMKKGYVKREEEEEEEEEVERRNVRLDMHTLEECDRLIRKRDWSCE